MAGNQTDRSKFEQTSVIKSLMTEKYKPGDIYSRMCDVYREAFIKSK